MSAAPIGIVLVGFAGIGTQDHQTAMYLPAFLRHPDFEIRGVVDAPGATGAERAAAEHGLRYLSDLDEALADTSVTAVSIAAPFEQRAEIVSRAIQAGKHVLADKPLAVSLAEVEQIHRLAGEYHVCVVPAHHQRLHGGLRATRAAVRAGRIGLPWNIQADFLVAGGDPAPTGELINLGLYPIDVVHALLGLDVLRVYARDGHYWHGTAGDFVTLLLDHQQGVTSTIVCGRTGPIQDVAAAGVAVHRYRISGSHGVLTSDVTKPALAVRSVTRHELAWVGPNTIDALLDVLHAGVTTGNAELGTADAVYTQRVIDAAQKSLSTGRPVDLETTKGSMR